MTVGIQNQMTSESVSGQFMCKCVRERLFQILIIIVIKHLLVITKALPIV